MEFEWIIGGMLSISALTTASNRANQIQTAKDGNGTSAYTFDGDGNQQVVQSPSEALTTNVRDYENRLTGVQLPDGTRVTMVPQRRRDEGFQRLLTTEKGTEEMATTYYTWDPLTDNVMTESDENSTTTAVYTHKPEQYGRLISQRRGGATSYYRYDGQGSTRQLTDENGDVTDTATYTAFGEKVASSGTTTNPFGYKGAVGYYANPETDDVYVRARTYEPAMGRWLSAGSFPFAYSVMAHQTSSTKPLATKKLNITLYREPFFNNKCGCGDFEVSVHSSLTADLPQYPVSLMQWICISYNWQKCEASPQPSRIPCCEWGWSSCQVCFLEDLGEVPRTKNKVLVDVWKGDAVRADPPIQGAVPPNPFTKAPNCHSRGVNVISSEIRLFKKGAFDNWYNWQDPSDQYLYPPQPFPEQQVVPGNKVRCGDRELGTSRWLSGRPKWFDTDYLAKGTAVFVHAWECCPRRGAATGKGWFWSSSGGFDSITCN